MLVCVCVRVYAYVLLRGKEEDEESIRLSVFVRCVTVYDWRYDSYHRASSVIPLFMFVFSVFLFVD